MPDDEMGWWDPTTRTIEINRSLSRVERRCTLAHEIQHVLAADSACLGTADDLYFSSLMERRASVRAARELVPLEALAEAVLLHNDDDDLMAAHLDCDLDTLDTRRMNLSVDERRYLRERMTSAMGEEIA